MSNDLSVILVVCGFLLILLAWGLFDWKGLPKIKTRPPAVRILELVAEGTAGGFYSRHPNTEDRKGRTSFFLDYVLTDGVTGKRTYLGKVPFHNSIHLEGDLEWMNKYEAARLYSIVENIHDSRKKSYEQACRVEKAARHERERQRAVETYKDR